MIFVVQNILWGIYIKNTIFQDRFVYIGAVTNSILHLSYHILCPK
jgi:hypothetical protein